MELELSKVGDGNTLSTWARRHNAGLIEDGSLPGSGVEIVTSPTAGDILIEDLESLGKLLPKVDAEVNDTCGLHVHVDARDFTQSDLRRVIVLYSAVERACFELVSRTRMGNLYCQSCGRQYLAMLENDKSKGHKDFRKHLHELLYSEQDATEPSGHGPFDGRDVPKFKKEKYHYTRYYALNLHSYFFRKTIEFRLHEAHLNPKVFINWSLFCGWIIEKAATLSERQVFALMSKHAKGNGESLLADIMPKDAADWILERLHTRRAAREDGGSVESTNKRLSQYTIPSDTLKADIWHTANKESK